MMNTVVLELDGRFIAGFSIKTQRVYTTHNPDAAKRFTAVAAQQFIREHANKRQGMNIEQIRIHIIQRGKPFDPFGEAK